MSGGVIVATGIDRLSGGVIVATGIDRLSGAVSGNCQVES